MEYPKYKREEKLSAKLSEEDLVSCRKLRENGMYIYKIAKKFGISTEGMRVALMSEKQKKYFYKGRYKKNSNPDACKKCKERKKKIFGENVYNKWIRSYSKEWNKKNPEKYKEQYTKNANKNKYYLKNKEKILAKQKEKYWLNKLSK